MFSASCRRMFLKEALLRCSQLQHEIAAWYDALCETTDAGDLKIAAWKGTAARERRRAGFLEALAALCGALEDEGPFVVQVPLQLEALGRALHGVARRRQSCPDHTGCECADHLDSISSARLYADLLELAEPELRRSMRAVGNEIRILRRVTDAARPRPERNPVVAECRVA